jgi:hypothetical protein
MCAPLEKMAKEITAYEKKKKKKKHMTRPPGVGGCDGRQCERG